MNPMNNNMTKAYEIKQGKIGPITLGMNKEEVRDVMKDEPDIQSLERGTIPAHFPESDMFFDASLVIEYDQGGLVETITLLRDILDITPTFQGKDIFGEVASDVIQLFIDFYGEPQKKNFPIESCYSWPDQKITLQVLQDSELIESITISTQGRGCIVSPLHVKVV